MELQLKKNEAELIVKALGIYKSRIGQKARWQKRKRQTTLKSRLADGIAINDAEYIAGVRKALSNSERSVEYFNDLMSKLGKLSSDIMMEVCKEEL